jgi:hypothetical protein
MKNISYLLTALFPAGILGLSAIPVKTCEDPVHEDIEHSIYDPTDDIHFG